MRIIAGKLKGKILKYPPVCRRTERKDRLRPTTDKIRSVVFNMIKANFPDLLNKASVCDIFSGPGAVGIETLSHGAETVTFIENNKITLRYLKENLKGLENNITIIPLDARRAIDKIKLEKFDMIFLDPPYNKGLIEPIVSNLAKYNMLNKNGIIVIEHHKKEQFAIPDNMTIFKRKDYNDTIVTILTLKED